MLTLKRLKRIADGMQYIDKAVADGAISQEHKDGYNAGVMDMTDQIGRVLREEEKPKQIQSLLDEAHGVIIALLDIAEEFYPKYSSSDMIAEADDLLKKIDGEE